MSDRTFSFVVHMPQFISIFTRHMKPIIEEVDFDVDASVDLDAFVVEVYDPSPFREYVRLIEAELLRMRKASAQALEDHAHVEMEVDKWHHNGDFFYKKVSGWEPPRTFTPPSSLVVLGPINLSSDFDSSDEEFLKTLEDLAAKQKREKK